MRCTPTIHDLATPPSLSSRPDAGLSALAPAQRAGAQRLCALAQSRRATRLDECLLLGEQRTCSGNATTSVFDPGCVKTCAHEKHAELFSLLFVPVTVASIFVFQID